jgi:hypothetical protein
VGGDGRANAASTWLPDSGLETDISNYLRDGWEKVAIVRVRILSTSDRSFFVDRYLDRSRLHVMKSAERNRADRFWTGIVRSDLSQSLDPKWRHLIIWLKSAEGGNIE